jgi:hypothetical protein
MVPLANGFGPGRSVSHFQIGDAKDSYQNLCGPERLGPSAGRSTRAPSTACGPVLRECGRRRAARCRFRIPNKGRVLGRLRSFTTRDFDACPLGAQKPPNFQGAPPSAAARMGRFLCAGASGKRRRCSSGDLREIVHQHFFLSDDGEPFRKSQGTCECLIEIQVVLAFVQRLL